MTGADYMRKHPDENLGWCKAYRKRTEDGDCYEVCLCDGRITAVKSQNHEIGYIPYDQYDEIVRNLAMRLNPSYEGWGGWSNESILLSVMDELPCADCPWFPMCDAMMEECEE